MNATISKYDGAFLVFIGGIRGESRDSEGEAIVSAAVAYANSKAIEFEGSRLSIDGLPRDSSQLIRTWGECYDNAIKTVLKHKRPERFTVGCSFDSESEVEEVAKSMMWILRDCRAAIWVSLPGEVRVERYRSPHTRSTKYYNLSPLGLHELAQDVLSVMPARP